MDLRSLNYFSVVAEELNFTRAAQRLNMSQPPLSNQIKALEEELGTQLFVRGGRALQLTEAGKLLYRRASQLLDLAERTREEVSSLAMGLSGTMCLGSVAGLAPFLAARWISGFREEYPLVRFEIVNGSSDDVIDQILRGYIELGIIAAPYDSEHLEGIPIGDEPWCAIMSQRHPLAAQPDEPLPLKALSGQPLIVPHRRSRIDEIRSWFRLAGAEPNIIGEHSNFVDVLAMAHADVGISIFPQTTPEPMPGIVCRRIVEPSHRARYLLVRKRNTSMSELSQTFLDFVLDDLEAHPANLIDTNSDGTQVPREKT
ncbi:MAG: LysR family transcriptional regulator [Candidatus Faecousia sp.]|nr:LysR family transcriptional regulator [Candidatus Faecousia sp.]